MINLLRGIEAVAYKAVERSRCLLKIISRGVARITLAYLDKVDSVNIFLTAMMLL